MSGGFLPIALLIVALGVVLAFASRRAAWQSISAFVPTALVASMIPWPARWQDMIFLALWVSTIFTASLVYLPRGISHIPAVALGLNAGLWAGTLASSTSTQFYLVVMLPVVLIFLFGSWLATSGYGIAVKVVASWIIAIGVLAALVSLTPTPGYKPDHME